MKPYARLAAVLVTGTLAACSVDTTGPQAVAPSAPARALSGGSTSQHLVIFKGPMPADFAQRVEAVGGTVLYAHAGLRFAAVAGLTDDAAVRLGTSTGADVAPDAEFQADIGASTEADASDVIASQLNPTTAARYAFQWNMRFIHANTAWAAGKLGSPGVTVAILDTGLDYDINDLNGLVDLSRSTSFVASDNALTSTYFPSRHPVNDYNGHGTNVASQVSSKAFALAGVTSRTTLMGVKVLSRTGSGSTSGVLAGIAWAADHGANVANMSLGGGFAKNGGGSLVSLIQRTMNYARQRGMLIVVSAGNDAENLDNNGNVMRTYCDAVHVICVSAVGPVTPTGSGDIPSYYTNFGRSGVSVAAPGGNSAGILAAWPWGTDSYSWVWSYCAKYRVAGLTGAGVPVLTACSAGNRITGYIGTSQASPHVAGLAALLMAEYGTDAVQTRHRILTTALDQGDVGTDPYFGRGRIDVAAALGL